MTKPRILVLGWIGSSNLGDELIAEEMCRMLGEAGCAPSVVTVDEQASTRFGVPMIRHAGGRDALPLARAVARHDGVVFGGGGLIQDETGPLNIPFHLSRLATARLLRKPWAGVGLGIGEVRRRSGRVLIRTVLRNAVSISVRDAASARRHHELTGQPATIAADPVFLRQPAAVDAAAELVVSLRWANTRTQRRLQTTSPPDRSRIARWAEVVDAIAEPRGLAVRFIAWERAQDAPLHDAVAAILRSPAVTETPGPAEIVERMGAGRLVLTMRYHGAVAAILHRRPCVLLDYSPKMADLVGESHGGIGLVPVDADATALVEEFETIEARDDARVEALAAMRARADENRRVVDHLVSAVEAERTGG